MAQQNKNDKHELLTTKQFAASEFKSQRLTDLTITCQDKSFHVHKLILSMKSGFFKKAYDMDGTLSHAKLGNISLDNDHPALVKAMLKFCYTDEINTETRLSDTVPRDYGAEEERLIFCIELFATAHKYQIEALKQKILDEARISLLYWSFNPHEARISPIVLEYNPTDLTRLSSLGAARILRRALERSRNADRRMRILVLKAVCDNIDTLVQNQWFRKEADQIKNFWKLIARFHSDLKYRRLECPICKDVNSVPIELQNDRGYPEEGRKCYDCGRSGTLDQWFEQVDDYSDSEIDAPSDDESTTVMTPGTEYSIVSR